MPAGPATLFGLRAVESTKEHTEERGPSETQPPLLWESTGSVCTSGHLLFNLDWRVGVSCVLVAGGDRVNWPLLACTGAARMESHRC